LDKSSFSIKNVITTAIPSLLSISENARLEVELLLSHLLGVTRSHLHAWPDNTLTVKQFNQFQAFLQRRCQGEPTAYLIGYKEFWSLKLRVTPATLIPRPETELLVELALKLLPATDFAQLIDLGTGSGAIALTLAQERPQWQIIATDCYPDTLAIAQENAQQLNLTQVHFLLSDWFTELKGIKADLIIANPPYIAESDPHLLSLSYEPKMALVAGTEGLIHLEHLITHAPYYLTEQGWLLLEHGYQQMDAVQRLFLQQGYTAIKTYQDLAHLPRVTLGQMKL